VSKPLQKARRDGGRTAWRAFGRDRRGVAAVEFALLAIPFFLMLFAVIETSLVFLAEFTLDRAVEKASRIVRTGEAQKAAMSAGDFRSLICSDVGFLMKCDGLAIDLNTYASFTQLPPPSAVKSGDVDSSGFGYQLGAPQTVQTLRAYYKWPIITDMMRSYLSDMNDGSHLLSSITVFRTEPY
jgi:Flp pilus assembly protein TadG